MEPPALEKYKIIYKDKIKEIDVKYVDIEQKILREFLEDQGIFKEFEIESEKVEIKNEKNKNILNEIFNDYGFRDENKQIVLTITDKEEDAEEMEEEEPKKLPEEIKKDEEEIKEDKEEIKDEEPDKLPESVSEEMEDEDIDNYNKLDKVPYYILNDRNKFFNWVYPTFEETSYKYIENTEKLKEIGFNEKQGQLFTKQFLVDSPYRGILLYHGLGTGKTCAGLITSENLIEKKHALILTPASLRQTWIDELKFCGDPIYKDSTERIYKNYTFINYNSTDIKKIYSDIKNNIYLDSRVKFKKSEGEIIEGRVIEITKGIFKKNKYNPTHVKILDNSNNISEYNIKNDEVEMIDNSNPFDNKIIIFDEVHNFIVTIANIYKKMSRPTPIQQIKKDIYDDLRNAINCKIILLSGTPIVNNAYEISFIANILNGNNMIYKYEYILMDKGRLNISKIEENIKKKVNFINYVNIELNQTKLVLDFMINPDYFINRNHYEIEKEEKENLKTNDIKKKLKIIKNEIEIHLKQNKPIFKSVRKLNLDSRIMPNNSEMFEKLFLEKEYDHEYRTNIYKSIKNINSLKSLLAGKISYLRGDLPTKTIINIINLPMGNLQESQYVIARRREIISSRRKKQQDEENLANLRSKSRQICNIFIPSIHKSEKEEIEEEEMENSEDSEEEEEEDDEQDDKKGKQNKKEKKIDPRNKNVNDFIEEKIKNIADKKGKISELILENIKEYSCKCEHIIRVIIETTKKNKTINGYFYPQGKVLIYSDFRELYSGGVSFIAELLAIADLGYIDFSKILETFITELNDEEKKIYEGANWGGNETNKEYLDFQNKLLDYLENYQSKNYHNRVFYLWHTSDTQHMKVNYLAKFVYNNIQNLDGSLLRIMFITKSGSEGISFKAIRQVHIMEPFWQQTREVQVIGRAVRYKSHDDLPIDKKNVYVYKYLASFTNKSSVVDKDLSVDKNLTTDEYITEVSEKKQSIINSFYELIKQVALECPYNNETMTCFSYNNINYYEEPDSSKSIIFNDGISTYNVDILRKEAYLVKKNRQSFIVYNENLYDYEKYYLHNTLIKIGEVDKLGEDLNFKITRDYSASETCFIKSEINTNLKKNEFKNTDYYIEKEIEEADKITVVSFIELKGGSNESDNESDYNNYTDDDNESYESSEEEIEETFQEDEDLEIKEEIFINNIKYKKGNFICLEDNLTNDKTLIGVILNITNKYIDISDVRIPIIKHKTNDNFILLYKVITKKDFINKLGLEMLNIYTNFDNVYKIYNNYIKNKHINRLVNNIYIKLKEYHRPTQSEELTQESPKLSSFIEELSPQLNEFIDDLTDKSLDYEYLQDLSNESGVSSLINSFMEPGPIKGSDYNDFKSEYIKLIELYYNLYKNYITKTGNFSETFEFSETSKTFEFSETFEFKNELITKIVNKFVGKIKKTNIELVCQLIEHLFYTECSLDYNDEISVSKNKKYKDIKLTLSKNSLTKHYMKGKKYNVFIDNIKKNPHILSENDSPDSPIEEKNESGEEEVEEDDEDDEDDEEEEESMQWDTACDDITKIIKNYKLSYYTNKTHPIELDLIETIWCLTEYMKTNNYKINTAEIKLFEDPDIIAEFEKQNSILTNDLVKYLKENKSSKKKKGNKKEESLVEQTGEEANELKEEQQPIVEQTGEEANEPKEEQQPIVEQTSEEDKPKEDNEPNVEQTGKEDKPKEDNEPNVEQTGKEEKPAEEAIVEQTGEEDKPEEVEQPNVEQTGEEANKPKEE